MMTASERQALIVLAIFIGIVATGWLFKSTLASIKKGAAEANPERDTSQLTVRMFQAIDGFGTDEESLFKLAYECRGLFNEVSRQYKARYGQALDQALAEDLNSAELAKFYQILNSK